MKGRTETTDVAPRPDVPICDPRITKVVRAAPLIPSGVQCKASERKITAMCKKVAQYTKSGKFLASYPSVQDAAEWLHTSPPNIAKCARGEQSSACGFVWKYLEEK